MSTDNWKSTDDDRAGPAFDNGRQGRLEVTFAVHFQANLLSLLPSFARAAASPRGIPSPRSCPLRTRLACGHEGTGASSGSVRPHRSLGTRSITSPAAAHAR